MKPRTEVYQIKREAVELQITAGKGSMECEFHQPSRHRTFLWVFWKFPRSLVNAAQKVALFGELSCNFTILDQEKIYSGQITLSRDGASAMLTFSQDGTRRIDEFSIQLHIPEIVAWMELFEHLPS